MFKINPSPTFVAEVPISVPGEAAGVSTIRFTFHHKNKEQALAYMNRAMEKGVDVALLDEVIDAWAGVTAADGSPVPYSVSALQELLSNFAPAASDIFLAYCRELTEAKRKNS